jgi:hypothetical protein
MSAPWQPGDVRRYDGTPDTDIRDADDIHGWMRLIGEVPHPTWVYDPREDADHPWLLLAAPDWVDRWATEHLPPNLTLILRAGKLVLPELTDDDVIAAQMARSDAAVAGAQGWDRDRAALEAYRSRLASARPDSGGGCLVELDGGAR